MFRRWAFYFNLGTREALRRKKASLRQALKGRSHLRMEEVSDTRVDVVWRRAVRFRSVARIASLASLNNVDFALRRAPKGIKDDGKDEKMDQMDKNSTEKNDKKRANTVKDQNNTPKRRKKKTSKWVPVIKAAPYARDAKCRRWAFYFDSGNCETLQRKKACLRQVLKSMPALRMEDVSDTRVDVVWRKAVWRKSAAHIARLATERNSTNFCLRGLPIGIKDDGKDEKDSREKKDKEDKASNAKKDKTAKKDEKDKKSTPKKRKQEKKKTSNCVPVKKDKKDTLEKRRGKTSNGAPDKKDEKDAPKKAKKDTNTVTCKTEQCCNTLDTYFIRAEKFLSQVHQLRTHCHRREDIETSSEREPLQPTSA